MSDPAGKLRVFFTEPNILTLPFRCFSDGFLRHANWAVWYDRKDLEETLAEKQLTVFAVSSSFLREKNRSREPKLSITCNLLGAEGAKGMPASWENNEASPGRSGKRRLFPSPMPTWNSHLLSRRDARTEGRLPKRTAGNRKPVSSVLSPFKAKVL